MFLVYIFSVACGRPEVCPSTTRQEREKSMENVSSGCYKKPAGDTRNNWVTMMFVTKKRYMCFRKRYSRGSFWSGYEHHESTGLKNLKESSDYCRNQQIHHGVVVIDDCQQRLPC